MEGGRSVAIGAGLVTVGVCLAVFLLLGNHLIDDWHVGRVERAGHELTEETLEALTRRRSIRAAKHFLDRYLRSREECFCLASPDVLLARTVRALGDKELGFLNEALVHKGFAARLWVMRWVRADLEDESPRLPLGGALGLIRRGLSDADARVRLAALRAIPEDPRAERDAITRAIEPLLQDGDAAVRQEAVGSFALHAAAELCVTRLRRLEADVDPGVRTRVRTEIAAAALDLGTPEAIEEARDQFVKAWRDANDRVRVAALAIFERIRSDAEARGAPEGIDRSFLHLALRDRSAAVRAEATRELALAAGATGDCSFLIAALEDPSASVREVALDAVEWSGTERAPYVLKALQALGSASRGVAEGRIAKARGAYIPALCDLLDDSVGSTRSWAALVLSRLSATGCVREDQISALLSDPEKEVRLWALGEAARLSTPGCDRVLVGALSSDCPQVRSTAARLLRQRRAEVSGAFAAFERALGDTDRETRIAASVAVLEIDPAHDGAARVLSGELREAPSWTKVHALRELRTLGSKAQAVEGAVLEAARHQSAEVAEHARLVLDGLRRKDDRPRPARVAGGHDR